MREDVHSLYGVPYDKIRIIHNGIDLNEYKPTPNQAVLAKYEIDPAEAVRTLCRPDHPPEGDHPSGRRRQVHPPGRTGGALRGGPGHEGDRPRDGRAGGTGSPRRRRADHLDTPDRSPEKRSSPSTHTPRSSSARPSMSRSGSSTSRPWPARPRSSPRPSAESRRW